MRLSKGDLVKVKTNDGDPVVNSLLTRMGVGDIIGIIIQCRYKKDIYLFKPSNSPFTEQAYWIEGRYLLPYEG